jgi:hypothetical protein
MNSRRCEERGWADPEGGEGRRDLVFFKGRGIGK